MTGKPSRGPFRLALASVTTVVAALAGALLPAVPTRAAVAPPALATEPPGPAHEGTPPPSGQGSVLPPGGQEGPPPPPIQETVQQPEGEDYSGLSSKAETGTGFTLGRIGGIGLLHRQFLPDGLGWGLGGIAVYSSSWFLNAGAQGYYTLHRSRNERLYALAGAAYIQDFPTPFGLGLGLGWTLGESKGVAFSIELPCVLQFSGTAESYSIYPIPNVALVFNY